MTETKLDFDLDLILTEAQNASAREPNGSLVFLYHFLGVIAAKLKKVCQAVDAINERLDKLEFLPQFTIKNETDSTVRIVVPQTDSMSLKECDHVWISTYTENIKECVKCNAYFQRTMPKKMQE